MFIVIGLGLTGVSCVRYLSRLGIACAVIDSRKDPPHLNLFKKDFPTVPVYCGGWYLDKLKEATCLVVSPGVDFSEPFFDSIRSIPQIGDIELFMRAANAPIIGVTGSNAKSTVVSWLHAVMQRAGVRTILAGNVGVPVLDTLVDPVPEYYILELSSFQLETTPSLSLSVGTILNISEDHLDRYGSMDAYIAAKQRIYAASERWVINRSDPFAQPAMTKACEQVIFGCDAPHADAFGLRVVADRQWLAYGSTHLLPTDHLRLPGSHNAMNALAVLALGQCVGVPLPVLVEALPAFNGLSHRCQWVGEKDGVKWYNDSKATNVGATKAALLGLRSRPLILIAGGQSKSADFSVLRDPVARYVKALVLLGEEADRLDATLRDCTTIYHVNDLAEAVFQANQLAQSGDTVLFAPACASFDRFVNYEQRGEVFEGFVRALIDD